MNVVPIDINPEIYNDYIYKHALFDQSRFLVLKGGAGSGKSYGAVQKIITRVLSEDSHRVIITRKVSNTIRKSSYKLIVDLVNLYGIDHLFDIRDSDMTIRIPSTNSEILAVGIDEREKIKSLADPTMIWYEEPTELTPQEFRQMSLRLRGQRKWYKQEILSFNPISEFHWLKEEFFPLPIEQAIEKKGWAKMIRNRTIKTDKGPVVVPITAKMIHSTYQDNKFLDDEYKAILEDLKDKDRNYYDVYCLGKWGVIGELVYEKGWPVLSEFPDHYDRTIYGFDWGFHHHSALVKIGIRDGAYYVTEKMFINKVNREDLIKMIVEEQLIENKTDTLYFDSAEPELEQIFRKYGISAKPAIKGNNSVLAGIDLIKSNKVYTHPSNVNLNKELQLYKWEVDKDGNPIEGKVLKINDDVLDAVRYPIYTDAKEHKIKIAIIGK